MYIAGGFLHKDFWREGTRLTKDTVQYLVHCTLYCRTVGRYIDKAEQEVETVIFMTKVTQTRFRGPLVLFRTAPVHTVAFMTKVTQTSFTPSPAKKGQKFN